MDVLIGAADRYFAADVRPWMASARASGFDGDIYLICYRVDPSIYTVASEFQVELYPVNHTPYGLEIIHEQQGSPTQSHNMRMYHAWELLTRLDVAQYRFAIMTDVRDVIFQKNPSVWLEKHSLYGHVVAPSEGIMYDKEDWNRDNLIKGFGSMFYDLVGSSWLACNVGTIAGDAALLRDLIGTIFHMTEGRYYPSDQSSFNVLMNGAFLEKRIVATHWDNWAAQLGTTNDPTKSYLWERLCEPRPQIRDGLVYNNDGLLYHLVHQWDRVPELKSIIPAKYR